MTELYDHRWTGRNGEQPSESWKAALAVIPLQAVAAVLAVLPVQFPSWPPSQAEFLAMCLAEMGLPSAQAAYADACHHCWTHPIVYETARRIGVYEVRHRTEKQIFPTWQAQFARVCVEFLGGNTFAPPAAPAVEKREPPREPVDVAAERAKLRAFVGRPHA